MAESLYIQTKEEITDYGNSIPLYETVRKDNIESPGVTISLLHF